MLDKDKDKGFSSPKNVNVFIVYSDYGYSRDTEIRYQTEILKASVSH